MKKSLYLFSALFVLFSIFGLASVSFALDGNGISNPDSYGGTPLTGVI